MRGGSYARLAAHVVRVSAAQLATRNAAPSSPESTVALPVVTQARRLAVFGLLLVAEFFYSWAWNTVDVLRPYLRQSLGLSLFQAGSAYSAQGAGALIGAVVVGQLADRIGRSQMLVVVMLGYGAALIAGVAVNSYATLLAQRVLLGLFLGGVFPVVVGIYVDLFEPGVRGRLASLLMAVFSSAIVALGIAASHVSFADWHLLLWLGGLPPVALAFAVHWIVPKAATVPRERSGKGLPIVELFAPGVRRTTLLLTALVGCNFFAYQAFSGWLTLYLGEIRHLPTATVGAVVAVQFSGNIVGAFFWGWIGDRFGRKANAVGFFGCSAATALFLAPTGSLVSLQVLGFFYGATLAASVIWGPWLAELYPLSLRSTAVSISSL